MSETDVDLVKLWERHMETEFEEKSAEAAVATMVRSAGMMITDWQQ